MKINCQQLKGTWQDKNELGIYFLDVFGPKYLDVNL